MTHYRELTLRCARWSVALLFALTMASPAIAGSVGEPHSSEPRESTRTTAWASFAETVYRAQLWLTTGITLPENLQHRNQSHEVGGDADRESGPDILTGIRGYDWDSASETNGPR